MEKKHGNTRDRHFKRHLEKEKDEDASNNEEDWFLNKDKESHLNKKMKRNSQSDDQRGHKITKPESENKRSKLIDIVV